MLACKLCYNGTMIRCNVCAHAYCPEHHLKHGLCKIPVNTSVPFFTGLRTDPFPFTPGSIHSKLPLCCAPECALRATNQCANIGDSSLDPMDRCSMYFCETHSTHVHHVCEYPGCGKYAEKCYDRPFGCDIICCEKHYQMCE